MFYIFGKLQHQGKIWQKLGAILMDRVGVMIFCFRVDQTSDFDLRVCLNNSDTMKILGTTFNNKLKWDNTIKIGKNI